MLKWPSEGKDGFTKMLNFVKAKILCGAFALE